MANGAPTPPAPQVVIPGVGWVDVASRAITQVGFPVVIAGVLLWFVLGKFQTNMELITGRMAQNTETAGKLITTAQTEIEELRHQTTHMQKQTEAMTKMVEQAQQIIALQQQEVSEMRALRQEPKP